MVNFKIKEQIQQFNQEYNRISDLFLKRNQAFFYNYCLPVKKRQLIKCAPFIVAL